MTGAGTTCCVPDNKELTSEELEAQEVAALPDKEAMSTIKAGFGGGIDNFAMPINEAIAINNESIGSYAIADADQIVILDQTDTD
ncbi:MAG TPA: hypothetical protein VNA57_02200 [Acidimicrobiales bacterium]|nr:hypothetical protein [Acidimicrobiales bacterium]